MKQQMKLIDVGWIQSGKKITCKFDQIRIQTRTRFNMELEMYTCHTDGILLCLRMDPAICHQHTLNGPETR